MVGIIIPNNNNNKSLIGKLSVLQKQLKNVVVTKPKNKQNKNKKMNRKMGGVNNDFSSKAFSTPVMAPMAAQIATQQTTTTNIVTYEISDKIGNFVALPTIGNVEVSEIYLNPMLLEGTRLQRLAQNASEYRITHAMLRLNAALPTTSGASFVVGYDSNPDRAYSVGEVGSQQIFSLAGAVSTTGFLPITCKADPRMLRSLGWLQVDKDSVEIMKTTAGKFLIQQETNAAITSAMDIPLYLDVVVQFRGAAQNIDDQVVEPLLTVKNIVLTAAATEVAPGVFGHLVKDNGDPSYKPFFSYLDSLALKTVQIIGQPLALSYDDGSGIPGNITISWISSTYVPLGGDYLVFHNSFEFNDVFSENLTSDVLINELTIHRSVQPPQQKSVSVLKLGMRG